MAPFRSFVADAAAALPALLSRLNYTVRLAPSGGEEGGAYANSYVDGVDALPSGLSSEVGGTMISNLDQHQIANLNSNRPFCGCISADGYE